MGGINLHYKPNEAIFLRIKLNLTLIEFGQINIISSSYMTNLSYIISPTSLSRCLYNTNNNAFVLTAIESFSSYSPTSLAVALILTQSDTELIDENESVFVISCEFSRKSNLEALRWFTANSCVCFTAVDEHCRTGYWNQFGTHRTKNSKHSFESIHMLG